MGKNQSTEIHPTGNTNPSLADYRGQAVINGKLMEINAFKNFTDEDILYFSLSFVEIKANANPIADVDGAKT